MSNKQLKSGPVVISILVSLFIMVLVPLLRNLRGNPFTSSIETYTHLTTLGSNQITFYDFLLQQLISLSSPQLTVIVLPLLLGLGSLILFTLLIKPYVSSTTELCSSILVLGLTPAFLAMHIGLTLYGALLFFTLLIIYLFTKHNYFYLLFLAALFFLQPLYATFVFLGLFFFDFFRKENKRALVVFIFYLVLLFVSSFIPLIIIFDFTFGFAMNDIFSFLGGRYGYSLVLVLLGTGGFLAIHTKTKLQTHRLLQALILVLSIVYEPARIVGVLLLTYYSVQGFVLLLSRDWHTGSLQQLTALLFICILIFSTTTYIKEEIRQSPTITHIETLSYLKATIQSHPSHAEAKILTQQESTPFVEFFSGLSTQQTLVDELLASQSFTYVSEVFKENNIAFVLVDPTMKRGGAWHRSDEGLLFVMHYTSRFKKIYDQNDYQIYYFFDWNTISPQENASISRP